MEAWQQLTFQLCEESAKENLKKGTVETLIPCEGQDEMGTGYKILLQVKIWVSMSKYD